MLTQNSVRIICIIPARKGSVGLYRKNLRHVGFFTLVARAIRVAKKISMPVYIILSTDDKEVIRRYGKKVDLCIDREAQLSTSDSKISDVIIDAIQKTKNFSDEDIVLLLEPSSPNREVTDLNEAVEIMIKNNFKSLITVSQLDSKYHPYKLLKHSEDFHLIPFIENSPSIHNRQEITQRLYVRNGVAYLYRLGTARTLEKSLPDESHFVLTKHSVSNIDDKLDLIIARYFNVKNILINFFQKFKRFGSGN